LFWLVASTNHDGCSENAGFEGSEPVSRTWTASTPTTRDMNLAIYGCISMQKVADKLFTVLGGLIGTGYSKPMQDVLNAFSSAMNSAFGR
jgi:hypothetical protein